MYLVADVANTASQAVACRAGFSHEGVLRSYIAYRDGSRGDAALFSRLPATDAVGSTDRSPTPTRSGHRSERGAERP